ncbi:hypothetical protein SLEP1_g16534 [Rubroshorea leprosula]|uniref:Plant bHLH transcription factor ACT-like domain-containing protein n=1 Tax=Rubroshorea leprosula TaxID=152421 RepID=A0AAV5J1T8_9ROSI|nr:hypothetical protein SLEP1_g16534 [Rubroshorea leprosula]
MSSRKRASLYEKLQRLRTATNSTAVNKTSIIVDASRYIENLKEKVERLNQEISGTSSSLSSSSTENQLPMQVTVESLEKGFLINVSLEKSCPGLLISILEAFEDLGLDVLNARVSCAENFQLEAIGGENEGEDHGINAQVVKQAVLQAIRNWTENNEQG